MSMLQNAQYLRSAPFVSDVPPAAARHSDQTIYVFVYNHHYDWTIFHRHFPMSKVLGTARLAGWTWHINADGQPNIRRAYISPSTIIPPSQRLMWPSPATTTTPTISPASNTIHIPNPCTFGYIFSLPSTADRHIHRHFSERNTHIRALFPVEADISMSPRRVVRLNAITYFDPRNTSDLRRDMVLSKAQKKKWQAGLKLLRETGAVPREYMQKVADKLNGIGEVEAVWICPRGSGDERGMDLRFLAEGRVEDDVDIVDHFESTDSRRSPLSISVNHVEGPAPRQRLISGTAININSNSNSHSPQSSRHNPTSSSRTQSTTAGNKPSIAATITVNPGSGSITQKGSPSPQKRARNPFAKTNDDGDKDSEAGRAAKKYRKTSFGPAPRARRRK